MKKIFLLFSILVLFAACGGGASDSTSQNSSSKASGNLEAAKGGKYYGGIFKMNETEYLRSLYPLNVTEVVGNRITNQIYEGLVRFDQKDLSILPALAESWTANDDATSYTFKLRKGVKFHNDPCFEGGKGREVTVDDVMYNLNRLCQFDTNNRGYDFIKERIKGAKAYYEASKSGNIPAGGVSGIKKIDDNTVQIDLVSPFGGFLNIMALPFGYIYPKEAVEKYGLEMRIKTVGTGPFYLKAIRENEAVILAKNTDYWGKDDTGNQLPYLDGIRFSFVGDQKSELLNFTKGDLDIVYRLPLEMTDDIVTRDGKLKEGYTQYQFQEKISMTLQYYGFKTKGEIFNKPEIRQAFNYAIDRKKIVDFTVKGAGVPAAGIVPPVFPGFEGKNVKGYNFNPEKARKLLAEAGYPNGKGLEGLVLQINSGGKRNEQVAEAIQKMLEEHINVKVNITKMPFAQHLEAVETSKADFWRAGWIADYPDPENFLSLLWSKHIPPKMTDKSYLNTTRFTNAEYDKLYEQALKTVDNAQRNRLYEQADQVSTNEAPFLYLYYPKDQRMLQPNVRNFPQNAMEYRNLTDVYFVPEK